MVTKLVLFFYSQQSVACVAQKLQSSERSSVGLNIHGFHKYIQLHIDKPVVFSNACNANDFRPGIIGVQARPRKKCVVNMFCANPQLTQL